jgi:predicted ATP-dependent endonuclease of OLD family
MERTVTPLVEVESVKFSDGQEIPIEPNSITILVGPNNSGKTSTLREIRSAFRSGAWGPVLAAVKTHKHGDTQILESWLSEHTARIMKHGYAHYSWLGSDLMVSALKTTWDESALNDLSDILTTMLTVEDRLQIIQPQAVLDVLTEAPEHPMHVLYLNEELEATVNGYIQMAFGTGLVLNRGG